MTETNKTVDALALKRLCEALLVRSGFAGGAAAAAADVLVWADLRGRASHGVMRLPGYLAWARAGVIDVAARPAVAGRKGAVVVIEAGRALGPWVMTDAADMAVRTAAETGVGWVLVRNHSHAGAIGYYARRIAGRGMMAMVMNATRPFMAYHGTRSAAVGTNPLAIAMPGGWLFDMSPAAITLGAIAGAAAAGRPLPEGVASDDEGNPTTDPNAAAMPLPLGGQKGAGLSAMIECLVSLSVANPLVTATLAARNAGQGLPHCQNGLLVAVDLGAVDGLVDLPAATAELDAALKAVPRAPGFDDVLHPGERGDRLAQERLAAGIPLASRTWGQLAAIADELGVKMDRLDRRD